MSHQLRLTCHANIIIIDCAHVQGACDTPLCGLIHCPTSMCLIVFSRLSCNFGQYHCMR